jgi:hypothetical protein
MSRTKTFSYVIKALGAASVSVALAGCSVYNSHTGGGFSGSALTATSGLPIQVDGKVGGVQGAPLATAVVASMPASIDGTQLHYKACDAYTECAGDHLVWTFGPPDWRPASVHPAALSVNFNLFGSYRPAPNNVAVKVTLIQGGHIVASASGQVDADNPNDPAFRSLISDMSDEVLSGPDVLDWIDVL